MAKPWISSVPQLRAREETGLRIEDGLDQGFGIAKHGEVAAGPGADDLKRVSGRGALLSATAAASWSLSKSCERKTSA